MAYDPSTYSGCVVCRREAGSPSTNPGPFSTPAGVYSSTPVGGAQTSKKSIPLWQWLLLIPVGIFGVFVIGGFIWGLKVGWDTAKESAKDPMTVEWTTQEAIDGGAAIEFPKNWKSVKGEPGQVAMESPDKNEAIVIQPIPMNADLQALTSAELLGATVSEMRKTESGKLSEVESAMVLGTNGARIIYEGKDQWGFESKGYMGMVKSPKAFYLVMAVGRSAEFETNERLLDTLLRRGEVF